MARFIPFLDAFLCLTAAAALLALADAGFHLTLGTTTLSVRNPLNPAAFTFALLGLRAGLTQWRVHTAPPVAPVLPLATLILTALGFVLTHLTTVCGGADSFGYVSAATLLGRGTLSAPQPEATWLPIDNALTVLAPLGYLPRPSDAAIVPLYPLGFPALIAATTLAIPFERTAYLVPPAMTVVLLVLVHRIAETWTRDRATAWLATALVAWDPLVITYAKQPMSDVPATAWFMLGVWLVVRETPRPFGSGLAAAASFLTRPGGLGAILALAMLVVMRGPSRGRALVRFTLGMAPGVALQALLQWRLFGSPWQTGYGPLGSLYAGADVLSNVGIYASGLVSIHSIAWVLCAGAGLYVLRGPRAIWIVLLLVSSLTPYLLYFRFDHWETLRFVLPAVIALDVAAAAGTMALVSRPLPARGAAVAAVLVAALATAHAWTFLRAAGVPQLMEQERRYVDTANWIARFTPSSSLVLAGQHSGSIRHYAARTTLRWDLLNADDFEPIVREAGRRGVPVYVALDRAEQPAFQGRFEPVLGSRASAMSGLTLLPGAQVSDVQIWEVAAGESRP